MPDEQKKNDEPIYKTAAEIYGVGRDQPPPTAGLSLSPGLRAVDDSPVPNADRAHVVGPQQAACDPLLAGLDLNHNPMTRAENRTVTKIDGETVVPKPDTASDAIVGPSGVSAEPASNAQEQASRVTLTSDLAIARPPADRAEAHSSAATAGPLSEEQVRASESGADKSFEKIPVTSGDAHLLETRTAEHD